MRTTRSIKCLNLSNALCLYMIGDCTALEQRCDLGVVKAAITVGGPPSQDAGHAMLRFREASVRTHCVGACDDGSGLHSVTDALSHLI